MRFSRFTKNLNIFLTLPGVSQAYVKDCATDGRQDEEPALDAMSLIDNLEVLNSESYGNPSPGAIETSLFCGGNVEAVAFLLVMQRKERPIYTEIVLHFWKHPMLQRAYLDNATSNLSTFPKRTLSSIYGGFVANLCGKLGLVLT